MQSKYLNRLLVAALLAAPLSALADQVTCESWEGRRNECPIDTRSGVRMVEQLSNTACVEGRTWGVYRGVVWVDQGCRAVFRSRTSIAGGGGNNGGGGAESVTCESVGREYIECPMNTRGGVRLVEQLSSTRCLQGSTWGISRGMIWVDRGCRGVFRRTTPNNNTGYHRPYETYEQERSRIPPPSVDINERDDAATVRFRGGCEVLFAPSGQMVKWSSNCTESEKDMARRAYESSLAEKHGDFSDV